MEIGQGWEPSKSTFVAVLTGQKELSTFFFEVNILALNGVVNEGEMTGILYDSAVLLSEEAQDCDEPGQGTDIWETKDREYKDKKSRFAKHDGSYRVVERFLRCHVVYAPTYLYQLPNDLKLNANCRPDLGNAYNSCDISHSRLYTLVGMRFPASPGFTGRQIES